MHGRQNEKLKSMEEWNSAWKGRSCICGMFYLPYRAQFKDKEQVTPSVEMYNFSSSKKHFHQCATLLPGQKEDAVEICKELCIFWNVS